MDAGVDEFLAHYGVKGMKWGVRRRTNLKDKYLVKSQKFRDQANASVKESEADLRDIKSKGKNSKAFKTMAENEDDALIHGTDNISDSWDEEEWQW